jgi:hypothetical protein
MQKKRHYLRHFSEEVSFSVLAMFSVFAAFLDRCAQNKNEMKRLNQDHSFGHCAWRRRKDKAMRMASDVLQQEKQENGRCIVMRVYDQEIFGRSAKDHRHRPRDQIETVCFPDETAEIEYVRMNCLIALCPMPNKARGVGKQ